MTAERLFPLPAPVPPNGAHPPSLEVRVVDDMRPEGRGRGAPPPVPSITVRRPRLEQLIDEHADRRVIVVRGPAGAGKTVLAAQWAAAHPDPCAWLPIDVAHNNPDLLLWHLVETIWQVLPDAGPMGAASTARGTASDTVLREIVASITERRGGPVNLVLDAVDKVHDRVAGDILRRLVEHPPDAVRLVLVSRSKPRLGLERARLRGDLLDIGPTALRFQRSEIEALAATWTGRRFDPAELEQETLGWAAGLRLAELGSTSDDAPSLALREPDGFASEYIREELLDASPEHLRSFLEVTCWLPHLTGALCAALSGQTPREQPLTMSEVEALPILPVSSRPGAFRYPPILARVLREEWRRQSPAAAERTLCRAAEASQATGELLTALELFLKAGRTREAAKVCRAIATTGETALRQVDDLLSRRPELELDVPELVPWRVRAAVAAGRVEEATALLAALGRTGGEDSAPTPDDPSLVRAQAALAERRGDGRALLAHADRLLAQVARGEADPGEEGPAQSWRVRALVWAGDSERAKAALATLVEHGDEAAPEVALARAWVGWSEGDVVMTAAGAAAALGPEPPYAAEALLLEGWAHRERNQLALAIQQLREAKAMATTEAHDVVAALAASELARCQRAAGASMDALEDVVSARTACPHPPYMVDLHLRTTEARIRLDRGDVAGAHAVVRAAPPGPDTQLLAARVAAAQQAPTRAAELVGTVTARTSRLAVEKLLVRAQLPDAVAPEPAVALLKAVAIGEPLGLVRTFLDEGPALSRQLSELACEHRDRGLGRLGALARQELAQAPAPEATHPVEQLTARELAVLRMLPLRMSNREMAAELYVSVNTLKTHVRAIYRKLDVPHRSAAVRRAKALQLV